MIQTVMGWENSHLYEFTINTLRFAAWRRWLLQSTNVQLTTEPALLPNHC
jgi:hypothetical protein